jgi:hypothetical protein
MSPERKTAIAAIIVIATCNGPLIPRLGASICKVKQTEQPFIEPTTKPAAQ